MATTRYMFNRQCSVQPKQTNGCVIVFTKIGDLKLFPFTVHVNEQSMANILSLKDVANIPGIRVTMDTDSSRSIAVLVPEGMSYVFEEGHGGLHHLDTSYLSKHIKHTTSPYSFLTTVASNKQSFSRQQVQGVDMARLCNPL